ncbi:MAG: Tetratricopeptide 2 repeat protein, partial [Myxococcales bacterium]|nr:Tetratricopeptide 2 repeat protein [Myxococcales bacterium]
MRSRRWPHAFVALAVIVAWRIAAGQGSAVPAGTATPLLPKPKAGSGAAPKAGSAAGSGTSPKASPGAGSQGTGAGSAAGLPVAGTNDIPDFAPGPAKFSVTPFENHVVKGSSLDWIIAEAPFEIAEKTESVLGLDPTDPPLYVPGERVPPEPDTVAAYAAKTGAQYVITGWFDRPSASDPNIELRLDVIVWTITGKAAKIAGEAQRMGRLAGYHKLLGDVIGEAWTKAGITIDVARAAGLARSLSPEVYPVFMMGRGLGYLTGAIVAMADPDSGSGSAAVRGPDLKAAEHDLERAVFLDPKLYEGQRLVGEVYMATVPPDPRLYARAAGKFNYASDLAPDDIASLRAAAFSMSAAGKWEVALEMFRKLVTRKPWDLELRYQLGRAMWQVGDAPGAQHQLEQVTARLPDHLAARRVLVLIHSSRSDTVRLVSELEAIAKRAPDDLETKADLATAYGALGQWPKAVASLEQVAFARPNDMPLLVRVGDGHRKNGDLEGALQWYARAQHLEPTSSLPGFAIAQALYDANRLGDALKAYTALQKYWMDLPAAEQALGAIALVQNRADDAAWYLRRAVREAPRNLPTRQAVIAAELMRKDAAAALAQLEPALASWPQDGTLHYLAGVAHHLAGDNAAARTELAAALQASPGVPAARAALGSLDAGGGVT